MNEEKTKISRRALLAGAAGTAGAVAVAHGLSGMKGKPPVREAQATGSREAPEGDVWAAWKARGWAKPARYTVMVGDDVQCGLCPNRCRIKPGGRGACGVRVNREGKAWTLDYGNACSLHVDPVEKKPLYHFLPGTGILSMAAAGCCLSCQNCQNWTLSQALPEETKTPFGDSVDLSMRRPGSLSRAELRRADLFPDDIPPLAATAETPSVAFTYSEPGVWYEYMIDSAKAAKEAGLKTVWVTCGYLNPEPLADLVPVLDAANVDLKSFDDAIYRKLNAGRLEPVLETLKTLKREGVWVEVTNLVVPEWTDDISMIREMSAWIVEELGPETPLHLSRFRPAYKLRRLPPTPDDVLKAAEKAAHEAGLHHVYIGNALALASTDVVCPACGAVVVDRHMWRTAEVRLDDGACPDCGATVAGVWR